MASKAPENRWTWWTFKRLQPSIFLGTWRIALSYGSLGEETAGTPRASLKAASKRNKTKSLDGSALAVWSRGEVNGSITALLGIKLQNHAFSNIYNLGRANLIASPLKKITLFLAFHKTHQIVKTHALVGWLDWEWIGPSKSKTCFHLHTIPKWGHLRNRAPVGN